MACTIYPYTYNLSTTFASSSSTLHALLGNLGRADGSRSLGSLLFSLLRLGLGDGGSSSSGSDLGFGLSFGKDRSKIGTNDSSL